MHIKLSLEYVKEFINKENTLISNEYINNKKLLEILCSKCNKIFKQTFSNYNQGSRCIYCQINNFTINASKYGEKAANIRYNTTIFIKNTIRICDWCKKKYKPKRTKQKICSQLCSTNSLISDKKLLLKNGKKGGIISAASQQRRSKNEIAFAELCIPSLTSFGFVLA